MNLCLSLCLEGEWAVWDRPSYRFSFLLLFLPPVYFLTLRHGCLFRNIKSAGSILCICVRLIIGWIIRCSADSCSVSQEAHRNSMALILIALCTETSTDLFWMEMNQIHPILQCFRKYSNKLRYITFIYCRYNMFRNKWTSSEITTKLAQVFKVVTG